MDDPKARFKSKGEDEPAAVAPTVQMLAITPEMLAELLKGRSDSDDFLQKQARYQAEAHQRLVNPSNPNHPGISVYSNPKGEVADPKPPLKCQMFWVGYEETIDTLTPIEVDLLNQMVPGEYQFSRTDGTPEKLSVTGETDSRGRLTKMNFLFTCRGEFRHNLPGKVQMLREALGEQNELDKLRAENERLKQLAGVA